jgi:invasion associated locus B (IalB) protein
MRLATASLAVLAICFTGAAAADEKPESLGSFRDWYVYQTNTGPDRLCYALSQPTQTTPANFARESPYILISTWPGRKVLNEPSIVAGYEYKDGATVQVQVGADKFDFFTKNEGSSGGAWMDDRAQERKLIDAMKRGSALSITGISARGILTRDNYSLAGISAALDKIAASCK